MKVIYHHRTRGEGAEGAHIRGVVHGLRELGHEVAIASFPGADPEANNERVPVSNPASKSPLSRLAEWTRSAPQYVFEWFELIYNLVAAKNLFQAARRHKAALIYERYSLFMVAGVLVAKLRGIPIILEINDSALVERVRPLYYVKLAKAIEKWIVKNATGLVFISSEFKKIIESEYGDIPPSVVSPNGANIDDFSAENFDSQALKKNLGLEGKVVCGYVGAFNPWHGLEWFVDIIIPRLKEKPNLVLLLVGDGISFNKIKSVVEQFGAEGQVCMPGRVQHEQVPEFIAAMDYAVLPDSNIYGSPMKLFETMSMGKAMVVPAFPPIEEVIQNNKTSWLFAAGDHQACVEKVLQLSDNPAELQKVGSNARDYIVQNRQWKHNAEQLLSLLEST
ncbi:MAG: glycosyltransferase family 4 protein [Pseudomonadales bacterium]|nr:glycosyltransferase family 4 protein [Pseudomonadales bacterium]